MNFAPKVYGKGRGAIFDDSYTKPFRVNLKKEKSCSEYFLP